MSHPLRDRTTREPLWASLVPEKRPTSAGDGARQARLVGHRSAVYRVQYTRTGGTCSPAAPTRPRSSWDIAPTDTQHDLCALVGEPPSNEDPHIPPARILPRRPHHQGGPGRPRPMAVRSGSGGSISGGQGGDASDLMTQHEELDVLWWMTFGPSAGAVRVPARRSSTATATTRWGSCRTSDHRWSAPQARLLAPTGCEHREEIAANHATALQSSCALETRSPGAAERPG